MSRVSNVSATIIAVLVLTVGLSERVSGSTALVAQRQPAGGVKLLVVDDGVTTPLDSPIDGAEWRAFGLRVGGRPSPEEKGEVVELDGDLPRLSVRSESQWIAYDFPGGSSGLAQLHAGAVAVVVSAPDGRYRIESEGAFLSPGGEVLGLVVRGVEVEEILLVDLIDVPSTASPVAIPEPIRRIAPESLALSRDAVFFAAELPDGDWGVYRARRPPPTGGPEPSELLSERIAGPFRKLETRFAVSSGAAAFAAGSASDRLDVFVANGEGVARNVTSGEGDEGAGPIVPHSFEDQHLAVSDDGRSVAYGLQVGGEPELFVHDATVPGPLGRRHVTRDERFNPYIDQESLIFFDDSGNLIFVAGHDLVTTDVFGLNVVDPERPINLTRTGSGLEPPFLTKGTLSVGTIVEAHGLSIISATGFSGPAPSGVIAVDSATGETILELPVADAADFFSVGSTVYFTASPEPGLRALYRIAERASSEVGRASPGTAPRLLALAPTLGLVAIPGDGVAVLRPAAEPITVSDGAAAVPGDFTSAVLDHRLELALLARTTQDGALEHFVLDLRVDSIEPVFSGDSGTIVVGAVFDDGVRFLRGDSNGDGVLNISDPITTLDYLFLGGVEPPCLDAADTDDDGELALTDAVRSLLFLFSGASPPPTPFPTPGSDPTDDILDCRSYRPGSARQG